MAARHVVMLLSNAYAPDVRVRREAEGLVEAGCRVSIVCWDRQSAHPPRETADGIDIIRVQDVRSTHGLGWRQILYLPQFWKNAARLARELGPDVVHCHDLDTLYAGWRLKKQTGAALVFDAHEYYPALMSLYLPSVLVRALVWWERRLIKRADAVITASTVLRDEYRTRGISPVVDLGNYPDPQRFQPVAAADLRETRRSLGVPDDGVLVSYIGGLHRNRMVLPLIDAAGLRPDIHFAVWGDGDQRASVKAAAKKHKNVYYGGRVSVDEVSVCLQMSDIVYYGLRLDYAGAKYNAPNTLTQAMLMARPVVVTNVGDLGRIVEMAGCGILIDEATPETIAAAIDELMTPDRRRMLGQKGRDEALKTYNADLIRKRLVDFYAAVVP